VEELDEERKTIGLFPGTETSRGFKQPNSLDLTFRTGLPIAKDAGFAL
jgi:hypothetical protein